MARIKINADQTVQMATEDFLYAKSTEGLTDKTLRSYRTHFHYIFKYIEPSIKMSDFSKDDVQSLITQLRNKGLANNTIASYVRVLKAFLSWARSEGLTDVSIPAYKTEETVKETYSDEELSRLLKKPNMKTCNFSEYRTWVIINFMMNSGARASTIRFIQIQDVDLYNRTISYRHNKNRRVQIIPLCLLVVSNLYQP